MSAPLVVDLLEPLRGAYVEGACDYVIGRPLVRGNPYCPRYATEAFQAWALGWRDAEATFPRKRLFEEFTRTWKRWPAEERWAA